MAIEATKDRLIDREDCVLLIIDMQEKLLPVVHDNAMVTNNTVKLVRFAAIADLPVLVTEQENLGPTVDEIKAEIPQFKPIIKIEFDACGRIEFVNAIEALTRRTVIVAGIESHVCVTQTVIHLLPDFGVHVVSDAVSSRTPENRLVALERMSKAGATISSTEMVIFEVLQRAGTDEFRKTLKLIK